MKKKRKKSIWLKSLVRINLFFVLFSIFIYIIVGFLFDSEFFVRDLSEKSGIIAGSSNTILSVKIIGPPEKPEVLATPMCDGTSPYIKLTWNTTLDTDYYNIDRDSSPLVSGIIGTSYDDYAVSYSTQYSYVVTAFGPLGNTASDTASATTLDECKVLPVPICTITKFHNTNLAGYVGIPETKNKKPVIYGTTNMPNALINVIVSGKTSVLATTQASDTGYWTWQPSNNLHEGSHRIHIEATDPNDLTRIANTLLDFKINDEEDENNEQKEKEVKIEETNTIKKEVIPVKLIPEIEIGLFKLNIKVKNTDSIVYSGKNLDITVVISQADNFLPQEKEFRYYITDSEGKTVLNLSDKAFVEKNISFDRSFKLPRLLKPGQYKITVESDHSGTLIVADSYFTLKEKPLVAMGGLMAPTLTDVMSSLSWIIFGLLLLLFIFILLLISEYLIYDRSLIHITEQNLKDKGFLGKRKGVSK